jgi:menaquinone-dependent protoporphyrinogen oxidase
LIAYSSTLGCTEQCASKLKEGLGAGVELIRISRRTKFDLEPYESIIIGGSIHAGMIQRSVFRFCEIYLDSLLQKQVGLFVCCMDPDADEKELIARAFPERLVEHALASGFFGGELNIKKMNLLQKIMTRKAARLQKEPDIDFQKILAFAKKMQEL